jgi:hypothetical protein
VQYAVVLDVATRSHDYPVEVGPQNGAEPNAGPFFDDHVSDKYRGRRYEGIGIDLRLFTVERKKVCHLTPRLRLAQLLTL